MIQYAISVIVNSAQAVAGFARVEAGAAAASSSAKRLEDAFKRTFDLLAFGAVLKGFVDLSDASTLTAARLQALGGVGDNVGDVMDRLRNIALKTRTSFDGVSTLYTRTAMAAKDLGLTSDQTAQFTETLSAAIMASGATTIEATNAMIQLSQGIALGVLRGDELRSVMEQLPVVTQILQDHFKATRGEILQMGRAGKIMAQDIVDAVEEAGPKMEEILKKMPVTIGQALTNVETAMTSTIFKFNEATGVSYGLANAINFLAQNFNLIMLAAGPFVALGLAQMMFNFTAATLSAASAMGLLNGAMLSNPLVLVIAAIVSFISVAVAFREELENGAAILIEWIGEMTRGIPILEAFGQVLQVVFWVVEKFAAGLDVVVTGLRTLGMALGLVETQAQTTEQALSDATATAYSLPAPIEEAAKKSESLGRVGSQAGTEITYAMTSASGAVSSVGSSADAAAAAFDNMASSASSAASAASAASSASSGGDTMSLEGRMPKRGTYNAPQGYEIGSVQGIGIDSLGLGIQYKPTLETEDLYNEYLKADPLTRLKMLSENQALANRLWYGTSGGGWGTTGDPGWGFSSVIMGGDARSPGDLMKDAKKEYYYQTKRQEAIASAGQTAPSGSFQKVDPSQLDPYRSSGTTVNMTIMTPNASSFKTSQAQIRQKGRY